MTTMHGSQPTRLRKRRWLQCAAVLAVMPMLGGCFAALAIAVPAATAVGIVTERKRVRAATPRPEPVATAPRGALVPTPGVQLTPLTELPPPSGAPPASTDSNWQPFLAYARERVAGLAADGPAESALLAPQGAVALAPVRRACEDRTPGVLIDLDAGGAAFTGAAGGTPPANLAVELSRLRQAGVVVLWISRSSANEVGKIGDALLRSGLDPTGRDPLLLVRNAEQRKQTLREEANKDVCLLAIAGDERSDFDELFDYLREDANSALFDSLLGSGWFLVPPPLAASSSAGP